MTFLLTVRVYNRSFQSYLKFERRYASRQLLGCINIVFRSYLKSGRHYVFCQLSELTTVVFRATPKNMKSPCFPLNFWQPYNLNFANNRSFRRYLQKIVISSVFSSQLPLLLILLWVTQSLLKKPWLKPLRTSVAKLSSPLLWNLFW